MAASSSISSMGEEYVLPSTNSLKPYQYLVDIIGLDHNYCRPWSEREKIPHARPVKELFSQSQPAENESEVSKKPIDSKPCKEDELIDVDTVESVPIPGPGAINMQYDVMKSKIVMSEVEKYVSSASSKRTPDTWEELICRTGWTTQQNVLFDKILKIISAYRLAWLTYQGSTNEPILRRVAVDKATKRVRQILSRIEWDTKLTTWLHSSMLDGLSIPLLACYLDIIQTLRSKVPSLVDKMIAGGSTHRRVSAVPTDNLTALLKRPWEATVALTSFQRPRKITGTPLLLIVPGGPTTSATGNSTKRSRFWHHHLSHFGKVIPVTMHLSNSGRGVSIGQCLDHMIGAVQAKVLELKNHFPNRPVVLIGWATGALVSIQVSLKESVCAVICLGFPLLGVEGLRGGAGDPILDNKTPTMFVFGSLSTSYSLPDIEEFRKKLLADTSLLVIPGADDQLRLTSTKKKMEGVTQSVVDRRIMDDIGEFLNLAVSSMNDDSHPRLDYFDFDDVENRRKKPKTEYRKRPAGDGTGSATAVKKPRGRTPKAANADGNSAKKPKTVKAKKTPANKPVVLVPGTAHAPGTVVRPAGSIPIAPLHSSGILQGVPLTSVSVPISAVGVPLTGVPVSRVSIPGVRIPGVNLPVSGVNVPVSAVIKQGSLGGRSFVFPGTAGSPGVSTTGITTMVTSGNTHQFKIVMNPATDGSMKFTGTPKTVLSSESQSAMHYKTAIVTAPVPNKTPAPVRATTVNPTSVTSQTSSVFVPSTASQSSVVTSLPMTSYAMTSLALTSPLTSALVKSSSTSQGITSSTSSSVSQAVSTTGSKPVVVSRTVVTVPKSVIVSGQTQFIMHQGQLAAVGKQAAVRPSNPPTTTQQKPAPQSPRVTTPVSTKPQTTLSTTSAKQTTVRVSHAGTTPATTNLVRKTPSPQSMPRTIQVGVKRTVTYNPSVPSKTVTVVSRSLPSDALTTHLSSNVSAINIARLKAKLKTIQTLTALQTGGQTGTVLSLTNTAGASAQPSEGPGTQTTSNSITQSSPQSSAPSRVPTSLQGTPKSSAQTVSIPTTQITSKSSVQTVTSSTTPPKSSSQAGYSSAQTLVTSSARSTPTGPTPVKVATLSSPKPTAQSVQPAAPTVRKLPEHGQSTPQTAGQTNIPSTGKPSVQSVKKLTTHFIQVPASARSSALNTAKSNTQTSAQSSAQTSVQSSTQTSVQSSAQTSLKSSTQASVQSSAQTSVQSSAQTSVQSSAQTSMQSSAQTSMPSSAQTTVQSNTQTSVQSSTQASVLSSAQTSVQSSAQTSMQSSAQTSVQSSAQTSMQSSAQTSVQSSAQHIQREAQFSVQSSHSPSATSRATNITTPVAASQKDEPIGRQAAKVADVQSDQSDSSSTGSSKSDEEKLVEKINNIVKDVVSGKQRTTRQSVRRLVAAARLAEEQHKRGDAGETSTDQSKN